MKCLTKPIATFALTLCLALFLFPSALAAQNPNISSWAYEEVTAAIDKKLVPYYLQNQYQKNIDREKFCDLAIETLKQTEHKDLNALVQDKTGRSLDSWMEENPFTDTTYYNIVAAYALGIVSGRGGGIFDPYAYITRQEAAAFLMRTATVMGMDTSHVTAATFADSAQIGTAFTNAVNFVYQHNIMSGTGSNCFSPLGTYTREQSYVTIYRLFLAAYPEEATEPKPNEVQEVPSQADATFAIMDLEASYPEGMSWTNDNFYYSQSLGMGGYGCEGFALICSDAAFGDLPLARTHSNYDDIKAGDMIRIGDYHTVVVLGWLTGQSDTLVVTEGNYGGTIHWYRLITRASLEAEGFTVRTRYPEDG